MTLPLFFWSQSLVLFRKTTPSAHNNTTNNDDNNEDGEEGGLVRMVLVGHHIVDPVQGRRVSRR